MLKRSIENPAVPGFEDILPPPLPPPPKIVPEPPKPAELKNPTIVQQVTPSECPSMYLQQPQQPVGQMVPWWVPVDADSTGIYSQWSDNQAEMYCQDVNIKKDPPINSKRKIEQVDPAKDAAKVASAQSELSALMKPLKCDLCNAVMNSTLQAKLHYDGKPHQKKVSMFLNQSVKKLKTEEGPVMSTSSDWSSYCDACKTWFTSQADASQHYGGKKHLRATTGAPKKNSSKKSAGPPVPVDPSGRFGIGVGFQMELNPPIINTEPLMPQIVDPQMYNPTATTYTGALRCDLCGVTANRLEQLETHKRGIRHQKMLKSNGMISTETAIILTEPVSSSTTIDYSICRTPSGSYYCAPCDKSFTTENSFAQHIDSKKHKNQVNPKAAAISGQKSTQEKHKKHKV